MFHRQFFGRCTIGVFCEAICEDETGYSSTCTAISLHGPLKICEVCRLTQWDFTADYVVVTGQERSVNVSRVKNERTSKREEGEKQVESEHCVHKEQRVVGPKPWGCDLTPIQQNCL
jgi:hypothetical protein